MTTILGIDAAWTSTEPTGVALVQRKDFGWRCLAVAPSYDAFLDAARGSAVSWSAKAFRGCEPDVPRLLEAAGTIAGEAVDLVAVDMPMATRPFSSRRECDDAISAEFGARWCSAHSPNAARPGQLGARLSTAFERSGYGLATTAPATLGDRRLIEVYPHPALLPLLRRDRRVPYKVGKSRKYWPELVVRDRVAALLVEYGAMHRELAMVFDDIGVDLSTASTIASLSGLKRYEDALDALVCAWVGVEHLENRTIALGDETAAIWCPGDVVHGRHRLALAV